MQTRISVQMQFMAIETDVPPAGEQGAGADTCERGSFRAVFTFVSRSRRGAGVVGCSSAGAFGHFRNSLDDLQGQHI